MGTNGLWSYRWRRRYYTTYNRLDSYPEGLGNELVAKIPSDPDEFARWADALKRELDARDDGELEPPHFQRNGIGIEWTYVIDLDRNAFTIDGSVNIRFDKLPRKGEDWNPFFDRNHPASLDLCNPIEPSAEHIALYDAVQASQSLSLPTTEFAFSTCGVLMEQLFRNFSFVYNARSLAEEQPNDRHFFAAARGIVALATWGDFDLVSYPLLREIDSEYSGSRNINPEWIWDPYLRTVAKRIQPTHFWQRGVLFVLDSGLEDDTQLRGAIGRTVHFWRECADTHKRTVAFVISLRELVQVDLSNEDHVTHTTPVPLVSRNLLPQYDDDDFSTECTGFPVKMKFTPTSPGFAMLRATLTPELPASELSSIGPFPVEVLERLLDWCEADILAALGETCKSIRTLWLNRPRLDVGPYRLLHSVGDGVFTALDACGDTASVLVGSLRFSDYNKEGGCGYNLRLFIGGRQERVGTEAELIGLSVRPAEKEVLDPVS